MACAVADVSAVLNEGRARRLVDGLAPRLSADGIEMQLRTKKPPERVTSTAAVSGN
jgi:hypothetical protein